MLEVTSSTSRNWTWHRFFFSVVLPTERILCTLGVQRMLQTLLHSSIGLPMQMSKLLITCVPLSLLMTKHVGFFSVSLSIEMGCLHLSQSKQNHRKQVQIWGTRGRANSFFLLIVDFLKHIHWLFYFLLPRSLPKTMFSSAHEPVWITVCFDEHSLPRPDWTKHLVNAC